MCPAYEGQSVNAAQGLRSCRVPQKQRPGCSWATAQRGLLADSRHPDLSTDRLPRAGLRQAWEGPGPLQQVGEPRVRPHHPSVAKPRLDPQNGQNGGRSSAESSWHCRRSPAFPGSGWCRRRPGPAPPITSAWRRGCDRPRTKHGSHGATWATNRCRGLQPGCALPPSSSKVLGLRTRFRPVQNGNDSEGLWPVNQRKKLGSARCRAGHGGGGTKLTAHRGSLTSACLVSGQGGEPGLAGLTGHSPGPRPEQTRSCPAQRKESRPSGRRESLGARAASGPPRPHWTTLGCPSHGGHLGASWAMPDRLGPHGATLDHAGPPRAPSQCRAP